MSKLCNKGNKFFIYKQSSQVLPLSQLSENDEKKSLKALKWKKKKRRRVEQMS